MLPQVRAAAQAVPRWVPWVLWLAAAAAAALAALGMRPGSPVEWLVTLVMALVPPAALWWSQAWLPAAAAQQQHQAPGSAAGVVTGRHPPSVQAAEGSQPTESDPRADTAHLTEGAISAEISAQQGHPEGPQGPDCSSTPARECDRFQPPVAAHGSRRPSNLSDVSSLASSSGWDGSISSRGGGTASSFGQLLTSDSALTSRTASQTDAGGAPAAGSAEAGSDDGGVNYIPYRPVIALRTLAIKVEHPEDVPFEEAAQAADAAVMRALAKYPQINVQQIAVVEGCVLLLLQLASSTAFVPDASIADSSSGGSSMPVQVPTMLPTETMSSSTGAGQAASSAQLPTSSDDGTPEAAAGVKGAAGEQVVQQLPARRAGAWVVALSVSTAQGSQLSSAPCSSISGLAAAAEACLLSQLEQMPGTTTQQLGGSGRRSVQPLQPGGCAVVLQGQGSLRLQLLLADETQPAAATTTTTTTTTAATAITTATAAATAVERPGAAAAEHPESSSSTPPVAPPASWSGSCHAADSRSSSSMMRVVVSHGGHVLYDQDHTLAFCRASGSAAWVAEQELPAAALGNCMDTLTAVAAGDVDTGAGGDAPSRRRSSGSSTSSDAAGSFAGHSLSLHLLPGTSSWAARTRAADAAGPGQQQLGTAGGQQGVAAIETALSHGEAGAGALTPSGLHLAGGQGGADTVPAAGLSWAPTHVSVICLPPRVGAEVQQWVEHQQLPLQVAQWLVRDVALVLDVLQLLFASERLMAGNPDKSRRQQAAGAVADRAVCLGRLAATAAEQLHGYAGRLGLSALACFLAGLRLKLALQQAAVEEQQQQRKLRLQGGASGGVAGCVEGSSTPQWLQQEEDEEEEDRQQEVEEEEEEAVQDMEVSCKKQQYSSSCQKPAQNLLETPDSSCSAQVACSPVLEGGAVTSADVADVLAGGWRAAAVCWRGFSSAAAEEQYMVFRAKQLWFVDWCGRLYVLYVLPGMVLRYLSSTGWRWWPLHKLYGIYWVLDHAVQALVMAAAPEWWCRHREAWVLGYDLRQPLYLWWEHVTWSRDQLVQVLSGTNKLVLFMAATAVIGLQRPRAAGMRWVVLVGPMLWQCLVRARPGSVGVEWAMHGALSAGGWRLAGVCLAFAVLQLAVQLALGFLSDFYSRHTWVRQQLQFCARRRSSTTSSSSPCNVPVGCSGSSSGVHGCAAGLMEGYEAAGVGSSAPKHLKGE